MLWKPLQGREDAIYWYVLQTHGAAKVAFDRFMKLIRPIEEVFEYKHEGDKMVQLLGNRRVFFKSGENYQDLRIETLDGCIIDEMRQQHQPLWPEIIRPMLSRRKGWCDFLSTPNGYDYFYDFVEKAKRDKTGLWGPVVHAPSTEAWWWDEEEIASAQADMSESEYAQEILAEFRDMTAHKVYKSHGAYNQLLETIWPTNDPDRLVSDRYPIVVGLDFNLNPMSWHLGQCDKTRWYWFDEIHLKNSHTQEASKALVERLLVIRDKGLLRSSPNLIICGDATGSAGQRAAAAQSDYDIVLRALKEAGFTFDNRTPDSNPRIKDRVNNMNAHLRAADGSTTLFYNPVKCPELKTDFDRVVWKEKTEGVLSEGLKRELTHASDSVGYPVMAITPKFSRQEAIGLRVLVRG